ncbi:MAG: ABC transporter permease, partial [Bacteroidota bacterium]
MLKHYLRMAWRAMIRRPVYAGLNIFGLALGMAATILIVHVIWFESSFDRFHTDYEHTYRLIRHDGSGSGEARDLSGVFVGMGPELVATQPGVVAAARLTKTLRAPTVWSDDYQFNESAIFYADSSLFEVFDFKLQRGDPHTVLSEPGKAVVSEDFARDHFGSLDVIGKKLRLVSLLNESEFEISGILKEVPLASHLQPRMLLSWISLKQNIQTRQFITRQWDPFMSSQTYVRTRSDMTQEALDTAIDSICAAHAPKWTREDPQQYIFSQGIAEIYLGPEYRAESVTYGSQNLLDYLQALALIILLAAWINYINLATAFASTRSKEVGVRKAIGA